MVNKISSEMFENFNDITVNESEKFDLDNYIADMEKAIIEKIFKKNNYNISKTSRQLNISRQNLQHKIKKYNIK